ncbi:MAG TPA: hypothetical protein VFL13_08210 [Candidatus Baltobacteraceae bacterium]|nr:hypothetical protein [Candidatus Baltobacteraceae bacterium]
MKTLGVADAATILPELIDDVIAGNEILLTRDGDAVAKIVRYTRAKPSDAFGIDRGLMQIPPDFDDPLEEFKDYM